MNSILVGVIRLVDIKGPIRRTYNISHANDLEEKRLMITLEKGENIDYQHFLPFSHPIFNWLFLSKKGIDRNDELNYIRSVFYPSL